MDTANGSYRLVLWIIAVVLVLVLGANVYVAVRLHQERQQREEQAAIALELAQRQMVLVADMMENYRADAYGPRVDRIAEQQLVATEHQLMALQLLAMQGIEIIQLLAVTP